MKSPFFVNSFISLVFFTLLCASNQYSFYWIYAKSLFYKFIDMRYSVTIVPMRWMNCCKVSLYSVLKILK